MCRIFLKKEKTWDPSTILKSLYSLIKKFSNNWVRQTWIRRAAARRLTSSAMGLIPWTPGETHAAFPGERKKKTFSISSFVAYCFFPVKCQDDEQRSHFQPRKWACHGIATGSRSPDRSWHSLGAPNWTTDLEFDWIKILPPPLTGHCDFGLVNVVQPYRVLWELNVVWYEKCLAYYIYV